MHILQNRRKAFGIAVPGNFHASPSSTTAMGLSWTDVSGETGYYIERSADGSSWSSLITKSANSTSHSDTGLTPGSTYYYRIAAFNASAQSSWSPTSSSPTFPDAPGSFTVATIGGSYLDLTWVDSAGATTYLLERSDDGGSNYFTVATPGVGVQFFGDTGLTVGETYFYRIYASNSGGTSSAASTSATTV